MTERRGPIRTCVGCRAEAAPEALVRFVLDPEGKLVADLAGGGFGRGAWVHPRRECLGKAAAGGFSRSLHTAVACTAPELEAGLSAAAHRRVSGLLASAAGAGKLAIGSSPVAEALGAGRVRLVIVATDARAAATTREVQDAIAAGRAAAWGTKAVLGEATHRTETAVVGVLDAGFARALSRAIAVGQMQQPDLRPRSSTEASTEDE